MSVRSFTTMIAALIIAATPLSATERTINGSVSMGSGAGLVGDGKLEFPYAFGVTRGIRRLTEGCGVRFGAGTTRCIVKFRETNGSIVEIISAKRPSFSGKSINLAGSVFDADLCPSPDLVDIQSRACRHVDDVSVYVERANTITAMIRYNNEIRFLSTQRVVINCKGNAVSLRSFMTGDLPPGAKNCR